MYRESHRAIRYKKKNLMPRQAKNDDFDNNDDMIIINEKGRRSGDERREKRNDLGHRHQW
ncbi:MAG TPA: hypothetical protein VFZ67_04515 [Nitrososphaera sp.]